MFFFYERDTNDDVRSAESGIKNRLKIFPTEFTRTQKFSPYNIYLVHCHGRVALLIYKTLKHYTKFDGAGGPEIPGSEPEYLLGEGGRDAIIGKVRIMGV